MTKKKFASGLGKAIANSKKKQARENAERQAGLNRANFDGQGETRAG